MPSSSYSIERGIVIPICILYVFIASYQVYWARQSRVPRTKLWILFCLLAVPVFLLPHEIDQWNLFGILPLWLTRLTFDIAALFGSTPLGLIIYSHFQVHYATLRRDVPPAVIYAITASIVIYWIAAVTADLAIYVGNNDKFINLFNFAACQFMGIVAVSDFLGFMIIYRLIIEMKSQNLSPKCGTQDTFDSLLARMKKFHFIVVTGTGTVFIYTLYGSTVNAMSPTPGLGRPTSPDDYVLPGTLPACLVSWLLYMWWTWIPREVIIESSRAARKTTEYPRSRTHTTVAPSTASPHAARSFTFIPPTSPTPPISDPSYSPRGDGDQSLGTENHLSVPKSQFTPSKSKESVVDENEQLLSLSMQQSRHEQEVTILETPPHPYEPFIASSGGGSHPSGELEITLELATLSNGGGSDRSGSGALEQEGRTPQSVSVGGGGDGGGHFESPPIGENKLEVHSNSSSNHSSSPTLLDLPSTREEESSPTEKIIFNPYLKDQGVSAF